MSRSGAPTNDPGHDMNLKRLTVLTALVFGSASGASAADDVYTRYFAGVNDGRPCYARSYDEAHLNHANVVEFAWDKAGYPGYWYMYQKSIIADDPNKNNVYGFNFNEEMFTSSAAASYHSS